MVQRNFVELQCEASSNPSKKKRVLSPWTHNPCGIPILREADAVAINYCRHFIQHPGQSDVFDGSPIHARLQCPGEDLEDLVVSRHVGPRVEASGISQAVIRAWDLGYPLFRGSYMRRHAAMLESISGPGANFCQRFMIHISIPEGPT